MIKRIFVLIFVVGFNISTKAYDFELDGIYYDTLSVNTCEVVSGKGYTMERVTIPATVYFAGKDYEVVRIGAGAFYNQNAVRMVHLPASLTSLGSESFMHCYRLESIEVDAGNPLYSSYEGALYNKERSLLILVPEGKKEYSIASSVREIGDNAFYLCKSLRNISIPNGVSRIGNNAFAGCDSLVTVEIPNSIERIGEYSFSGCKSLTSLVIPNSVKEIGRSALSFCTSLKVVSLSSSLGIQTIPDGLFNGCTSLEKIAIPLGVISLGDNSFSQCDSLRSINIPNTVTTLGSNLFYNCHSLMELELPGSIETIGGQAFEYCQQLDTITIPAKVSDIGEMAFNGCRGLAYICVSEGNEYYHSFLGSLYSRQNNRLIKVPPLATKDSIFSTTTQICPYAYFLCNKLTSVRVSERINEIGKWAFVGCDSIDTVYMVKPVNLSETYLPKETRTLYVPKGKKTAFEDSSYYFDQYSLFKSIEEYGVAPTVLKPYVLKESDIEPPIVYNILGVKVGDSKGLMNGIYVINGKKVIFKK